MAEIIGTVIPTAAGLFGVLWGVHTYRQSQLLKRKETIFPLIAEYDESTKMEIAKRILDDFTDIKKKFFEGKIFVAELKGDEYYTIKNLHDILRDDTIATKFDEGEDEIRDGFDSLLAFFGKLEYLLRIGLIRRTDLSYFQYYIYKVSGNKEVRDYVKLYNFQLYGMLDSRLNRGNKEK